MMACFRGVRPKSPLGTRFEIAAFAPNSPLFDPRCQGRTFGDADLGSSFPCSELVISMGPLLRFPLEPSWLIAFEPEAADKSSEGMVDGLGCALLSLGTVAAAGTWLRIPNGFLLGGRDRSWCIASLGFACWSRNGNIWRVPLQRRFPHFPNLVVIFLCTCTQIHGLNIE